MENDAGFQYIKLFVENIAIWPLIILFGVWWLVRHPDLISRLPDFVSKLKVGSFELELRQLQAKMDQTQQQVNELENEVERESARFRELLTSFNPHAPVAELAKTREALKAMAPTMDDLAVVRAGLAEGASPEEVYAGAEIARARRDPALFDDLVSCLDRLARDKNLHGIRLHTVWTLTSALHRTLVADIKHSATPRLSGEQLKSARLMLAALVRNPRVLVDREDAPMQGVRGPAKWANDWIEKGLAKPNGIPSSAQR